MKKTDTPAADNKVRVKSLPRFGKTRAQIQEQVLDGEGYEMGRQYMLEHDFPLQLSALLHEGLSHVGDMISFTITEVDWNANPFRDAAFKDAWYREVAGSQPGEHGDRQTLAFAAFGPVQLEIKYCEPAYSDEDYACDVEVTATAMASAREAQAEAQRCWEHEQLREYQGYLRFSVPSREHAIKFREALERLTNPDCVAGRVTRPENREGLAALQLN